MGAMRRVGALLLGSFFALTACGGGGRSGVPTIGGQSAASTTRSVSLTLTFAQSSTQSTTVRKPQTISSSTESIVITVNGGLTQTFNIAPPQCTTSMPITCNFTVNAYVGNDTFLISAYSGTNGTGTLLDQATLSFSVSSSGTNTFTASLAPAVSTLADSGLGSLRSAVAGANPGDVITFAPGLTGTITLTSGVITLAQNVTISGPGASVITVSGGNASNIFSVSSEVTATISGLTLTQGNGGTSCEGPCGGAIYNDGTLTVSGMTFTNNVVSPAAGAEGGAIYSDDGSTLTVSSSTFSHNTANTGGAIGTEYTATAVTITNSTFTSNLVSGSYPGGGAIFADNDTTISGSTFTSNTAGTSGSPGQAGGAILEDDCTQNGLTLSGSTLTGNTAGVAADGDGEGYGGAVYDDSSCVSTYTGNTFSSNVASGTTDSYGGAIDAAYASVTLAGSNSFSSNSVTSQSTEEYSGGGAIEIGEESGDLIISGSNNTFTSNSVSAGPGVEESIGWGVGGAIDEESSGALDLHNSTGTSFTNNSAGTTDPNGTAFGGAIEYNTQDSCYFDECSVAHRVAPQSFRPAKAIPHRSRSRHGAAINILPKLAALRHGSAAARAQEAVRATKKMSLARKQTEQSSSFTLAGITFSGNSASLGSNNQYYGSGGALDIQENYTCITIANSSFSSNTISGGYGYGAAVSEYEGMLTLSGDTFTSNTASNGGGAIANDDGSVTITNSTLSGNTVTSPQGEDDGGGAIANADGYTLVSGTTINNNSVQGSVPQTGGGGIMTDFDSETVVLNSTVAFNTSGMDGGGAESDSDAEMIFVNATTYENTATSGSGGSLAIQNFDGGGYAVILNSVFARGAASSGQGPDIYASENGDIESEDYNWVEYGVGGQGIENSAHDHIPGGGTHLATSLAGNGGPTQTISDVGSNLVGLIPFTGGLCNGAAGTSVDQRGYARGAGGVCDIGAFESAGVAP